jgi:hypothetical protein
LSHIATLRSKLAPKLSAIRSNVDSLGSRALAGLPPRLRSALLGHRPAVVVGAVVLILMLTGTGLAAAGIPGHLPAPSPTASPTPTPTAAPTPTPTPPDLTWLGTIAPDKGPNWSPVAATTDGVWIPWYDAASATRHPIAVMIDDQAGARPQSGLSQADIVYQAPAEGGIPRYMAIFQTELPDSIGPIRSSRLYFVAWAEEWRAMYVHMAGAPNAQARLLQIDKKYVYNADGLHWSSKYMQRVRYKVAPHNLYITGAKVAALAQVVGATAPWTQCPFTFTDPLPEAERPNGGTIAVPYHANNVSYTYDPATNTYPRSVTGQSPQVDYGNKQPIAPSNVVVLYMTIGALTATTRDVEKHRLDVDYLGSGQAMVFNNGQAIKARWSKKLEYSPTLITYASGPNAGQPVPMVRGQIFIQVVQVGTKVTWTVGSGASPSPSGS